MLAIKVILKPPKLSLPKRQKKRRKNWYPYPVAGIIEATGAGAGD